uniref:Uncharacterized protein n=1 Tax=uncultured Desulfobacterium sp. TaxID=201089 RepID=E1YJT5_9BACT|nr:unknown protein [uncultured Desulfobacterium sp.]
MKWMDSPVLDIHSIYINPSDSIVNQSADHIQGNRIRFSKFQRRKNKKE